MKRLEEKKKSCNLGKPSSNKCSDSLGDSMSECSMDSMSVHETENKSDNGNQSLEPLKSSFSIESLLETPKVPRGRRPNSKYPRVQASKSMNPLALGMVPLYPITQPVGFTVEQRPKSPTSLGTKKGQKDMVSSTKEIQNGDLKCQNEIAVDDIETKNETCQQKVTENDSDQEYNTSVDLDKREGQENEQQTS